MVIPTRNRARLLERALDSVGHQNYTGRMHCVVSDNNSQDSTSEVVRRAMDRFPQIRWEYLKTNVDLSAIDNWERALQRAPTEWVKVVWDDDWMDADCLSRLIAVADEKGVGLVTCGGRVRVPGSEVDYASVGPTAGWYSAATLLESLSGKGAPLPVSPTAALVQRTPALSGLAAGRRLGACANRAIGPDLLMLYACAIPQVGGWHIRDPLVTMWGGSDSITRNTSYLQLRICYDRALMALCALASWDLPREARRRLRHRSALARACGLDTAGLMPGRISLRLLASNARTRIHGGSSTP